MKDKRINEKTIRCECGEIITGNNKNHTKYNLERHKNSQKHKRNIEILK